MSSLGADDDDARLSEIVEVVVAIASNDFTRRARVGDGTHLIDGLATGLNMLAEEIGERTARERAFQERMLQHERLIAVGQLAAGVAHELNNPAAFVLANMAEFDRRLERLGTLVAVGGSAELEEARQLVSSIRDIGRDNVNGVERMVSIVRGLRDFARLETGELQQVDLAAVVADACNLMGAEVRYRARFVVRAEPGLRVRADRVRLVQVVTNLVHNAVQAIPEGARDRNEVRVATGTQGDRALVTVSDTGAGMTAEVAARLFEPFFTTKPRAQGTGLGLAISADIVRRHGGELRVVETSSAGTTFEVSLPLDRSVPAPTLEPPPPASSSQGRARVLIIDDEPQLLRAYRRLLERDFDLTLIGGGAAALELLAGDGDWDAVVCDLMMTDVDGAAVHAWLEAQRPGLLERTLFCTGGAFTPRTMAFADTISERLLQKPLRRETLRAAVERVRRRDPR